MLILGFQLYTSQSELFLSNEKLIENEIYKTIYI